jgi:phosphatidylglycerol phospholipase C
MAEVDPLLPEKLDTTPGLSSLPPLPDMANDTQAPSPLATQGRPQCIGHRGYKAAYPENTMGAFQGAVDVGAHAIETDLHLSRDGVVVISHVRERCARLGPLGLIYVTGRRPQAVFWKGGEDP